MPQAEAEAEAEAELSSDWVRAELNYWFISCPWMLLPAKSWTISLCRSRLTRLLSLRTHMIYSHLFLYCFFIISVFLNFCILYFVFHFLASTCFLDEGCEAAYQPRCVHFLHFSTVSTASTLSTVSNCAWAKHKCISISAVPKRVRRAGRECALLSRCQYITIIHS